MHAGRAHPAVLVLSLVCTVLATQPGGASAQSSDPADYTQTIQQAVEAFQVRDFDRARQLFQTAHKLSPSARTLRGMGLTDFESGRYALAISELEAALSESRKALEPQQRVEVQAVIAHARGFVGNLELEIMPKNAAVTVDGVPVSSDRLLLDAGEHSLHVSAESYAPADQTVRVLAGDLTRVVMTLDPIAEMTEEPVVAAKPEVVAEEDTTQRTAAWIVGGVGAAGVIVGSVFGIQSILKHNESDRYCGKTGCTDPRGVSAMDKARTAGDISTVAFVAGGIALGVGTVLFLTAPSTEREGGASARISIGPGAIGIDGVF
jgi:hypothetical protein